MKRSRSTSLFLLPALLVMAPLPAMAEGAASEGQTAPWWTAPGETDTTAFSALVLLFLLIFGVFHLYARFDRFAEKHNEGTPLQTTVPTLLMVAFAYEIFPPLSHFSILLPLSLIATALARDLMLWFEPVKEHTLKGEIEGVMLEELQREHIGEHDRYGQRVRPSSEEVTQAQPVTVEPEREVKTTPPPGPQKPVSQSGGVTDND
ncbi:hypothetical protein [Roseibium polysiphoniae]|uniref:Uncharacterized protein n=1 Tax=Roseibium polysiphoniae TaxID=2571221 RepID=A0ABR9CAR8_9HYPH|nr:hypothetical protein [Roseibium polysiphoniae]MBD8876917.1 hypothetical protein [Roseibium polysiphoniae]